MIGLAQCFSLSCAQARMSFHQHCEVLLLLENRKGNAEFANLDEVQARLGLPVLQAVDLPLAATI